MNVITTPLEGVLVLEPRVFGDDRGYFFESFNARRFKELSGVDPVFVQDNHSRSAKGVLRGLHYQIQQAQGKLVRVTEGAVFDVTSEVASFLYKTTDYWAPEFERAVLWNDPAIGIDWPLDGEPQLSGKDQVASLLADAEVFA